jgi:hypothetical protein
MILKRTLTILEKTLIIFKNGQGEEQMPADGDPDCLEDRRDPMEREASLCCAATPYKAQCQRLALSRVRRLSDVMFLRSDQ